MPQMSPMWWELLFFSFTMSYLLFSIMIYFTKKNKNMNKKITNKIMKNLNWEW